MAKQTVFVPDGEFCSDEKRLGCLYEEHNNGLHFCRLFLEPIGKLETFCVGGERQRAFRKCEKCRNAMVMDGGAGINPD